PIDAFPTPLTSITVRPSSSKPPTIAPTKPFNISSLSLPPDLCAAIVELFLSTILRARIYYTPGWWEGQAQLSVYVNLGQWEKLPKSYQAILTASCAEAESWTIG